MTNVHENDHPKSSKINQNILIAIFGAVATIVAALIPWALNKYETQSAPTLTPLIITATVATNESTAQPSAVPSLTPTADEKTGVFDVYLASDEKGDFRSTSFSATEPFYLFFSLNDPSGGNIVQTSWTAAEVAGYEPNKVVFESDNKVTKPKFSVLANRETWQAGKYKIELYLNGTLDETVEFEVTK